MGKRWRAGLVSVVLMAVAAGLAVPQSSTAGRASLTPMPAKTRAMWLWGGDPAAEVVDWAVARGVSEIFVYVSPTVLVDGGLARLQQLRQRADASRIRLTALGGDSSWATDHAAALAWQRTVVRTGLFAGIHLDVEPYLAPGWTTDPQATRRAFLALLDKVRTGSTLPVEADVPFWFGQYRVGGKNLADEVLKRVTAVTVMSYRDTGTGVNSMLAVGQDWLSRGATVGKRVRLAAETGPLSDCAYCTFHSAGATRLDQELAKVDAATRSTPAFGGIAVHHYGAWRALPA
jgi:hypothetical protein